MSDNLLEIRDLHVWYGNMEALHGLDFDFARGKITAIIGSNGAGKSTTINAISGMVKRSGTFTFDGEPLQTRADKIVREGVVQVPEGRRIFAGLTVEENLRLGAYTMHGQRGLSERIEEQYELFPRLKERYKQDAGTLSGGEQQMLAVARGMMAEPQLLMLDEPSLGLAPVIVTEVFNIIKRIRERGITVILVEQNAKKSLKICDFCYVIENGRIQLSGSGDELLHNPQVADAYLGASHSN